MQKKVNVQPWALAYMHPVLFHACVIYLILSHVLSLVLQWITSPFSGVHGTAEIDLDPSNEALVSNYSFNLPYNCSNILPLKSNTEEDKPMEISACSAPPIHHHKPNCIADGVGF